LIAKSVLRKKIRQQRNALSDAEQLAACFGVLNQLRNYPSFRSSHRVAAYLANDGEVSLNEIFFDLWRRNRECYLPVLFGFGGKRMHFAPFQQNSSFTKNIYGILEPVVPIRKQLKSNVLDLVLMPLVAFDLNGSRLGMGGGYYDKSFEFLKFRNNWKKPKLIGVAHDFQQVDQLPSDDWDVPIDSVVTPTRLIKF